MTRIKQFCFSMLALSLLLSCNKNDVCYKDAKAPIEGRIDDLLRQMTLEEKILQLNQGVAGKNTNVNNITERVEEINSSIGSLIWFGSSAKLKNEIQKKAMTESRLGIPILFGYDVIHGFRTITPIPLAQACSWNPELVKTSCEVAAREAKLSGVDWTFSPMIDVSRDGRWGRIAECYGEDPYVNGVFGVAAVKGYQGNKLSDEYSIAACLKHYVGYGLSEGGRDYHYSEISKQSLWDTYLPPYKACIDAGAVTLMSSFNDISGVPASANHYTLTDILKKKWKHEGFVVSDWNAVKQLIDQGVAKDEKEAAMLAFNAGVEMDMVDGAYSDHLAALIDEGKVSMELIDESVRRILRVKFQLGLFDNPYSCETDTGKIYLNESDLVEAEQLAVESTVMLKNEQGLLPLKDGEQTIALIGPMAKERKNLLGSWHAHGKENDVTTIEQAMSKEFPNSKINYSLGCPIDGMNEYHFEHAISVAKESDVVILCLGEKNEMNGENASRSTIKLPGMQEKLVEVIAETGKPIIVLLASGRPTELINIESKVSAIFAMWQPGVTGGKAIASLLSGRRNPSGKLAVTFPLTTGQIPVYYNMRQSARPYSGKYQDISTEPLYWFGHGLSYSKFEYKNLQVRKEGDGFIAQVEVTNTSEVDGTETVHWFISDPVATISQPLKKIKHFEKKLIKAGEKEIFTFNIDANRDLSFIDDKGQSTLEPGDFFLMVKNEKVKFSL